MLQLPNNCRMGEITIRPANWKSPSANPRALWKIQYWFYDDNLRRRKLIPIQGMNRLSTLREKQDYVKVAIDEEIELLKQKGWNPVTQSFSVEQHITESDINSSTSLLEALQYSFDRLKVSRPSDIKSALKYIGQAAQALRYEKLPVGTIRRRHIKSILEKCSEQRNLTASNFNHYRSYLRSLFTELVEMEVIESNPVKEVAKQKQVRRLRLELDREKERPVVRAHLSTHYPDFWRFVNIFFHSGSRIAELLRLRPADVDLAGRRFKVMVKKGRSSREQWRPMKDLVVQDWQEVLQPASPADYLFSTGLKPGPKPIGEIQVTKRWRVHVKQKLGIKADLYSLKHSNLDETAAALQKHRDAMDKVKKQAGHSGIVVTMNYTQGEESREMLTVRGIRNEF